MNTLGPYIKHESTNQHKLMNFFHPFEISYYYNKEQIFRDCIQENRVGIFYICLVTKGFLHVDSLSVGGQKMCTPGTNAGGNSEISEALSYELFHILESAELVKVSRM